MVKQEGGKVRSAYMMADLPEGASVPYMPMAHSREHIPPALGDVDHMNTLSRELMPADTVRSAPTRILTSAYCPYQLNLVGYKPSDCCAHAIGQG